MPTYDYKCKDCKDTFEHFQKMTDEPLKVCSKCNGELIRLIGSGLSPVFKGKGFYQTDYKDNKSKVSKDSSTQATNNKKSDTKDKSTKSEKKKSA